MKDDPGALQVPKKFDATRSAIGSQVARRAALLHRAAFNSMHELQMRPTVEVLRWLEVPDTGDPFAGVAANTIQVPGLSALPTVVGDWDVAEVLVDGEEHKEKVRTFTVYCPPRSDALEGDHLARILLTDKLQFRGDAYDVVAVEFQRETGRCVATARLTPTAETS